LRVFGNKVAIFSNTAGSEDDYEHKLAIKIEKALGLSVIRHKEQVLKPSLPEDCFLFDTSENFPDIHEYFLM
jgi:hypothetical protein